MGVRQQGHVPQHAGCLCASSPRLQRLPEDGWGGGVTPTGPRRFTQTSTHRETARILKSVRLKITLI